MLRTSPYITCGNFTRIHSADLRLLFEQYDSLFFAGRCRSALDGSPLNFRISRRMTSAGGQTVRFMPRSGIGRSRYEIAVSSPLLYQAFADGAHRPISVAGKLCSDRLEALQRIFEHELVHLIETLGWDTSSCCGRRFQSIAYRFFGHTQHTHRLITPQERAKVQFQLGPGTNVRFRLDGQEYTGIVNRVTKRATVLVPDARGTKYSDGQRYAKFYVPLPLLEVLSNGKRQ